jgi:hypothetical protein
MCFSAPLFTIKGNLVFMNNLYKVALISVCTALSFTLGANKEAKAARFTLTATKFFIDDIYPLNNGTDGVGDRLLNNRYDNEFIRNDDLSDLYRFPTVAKIGVGNAPITERERRAFYEFNIGNLFVPPNTAIHSAVFYQPIEKAERTTGQNRFLSLELEILGYVGDGRPDLLDFGAGVRLGIRDAVSLSTPPRCYPYPYGYCNTKYNGGFLIVDVTEFLNERVSNGDAFAGFGIRAGWGADPFPNHGVSTLSDATLIIETEPVPEPATIFGSALALSIGGWLKRKKLSQQNKTTSQH